MQAVWLSLTTGGGVGAGNESRCLYTGSGKTPLACGVAAFMALAVGMFTAQVYILIAASPRSSPIPRRLTRQACFFFLATWYTFSSSCSKP